PAVVAPPATNSRKTDQEWRSIMKMMMRTIMLAAAGVAGPWVGRQALEPSDETVGSEPKSFLSVVGVWRIESGGNNKVMVVDGRQWKAGQASAGLAHKARALYGNRYAEFLAGCRPMRTSLRRCQGRQRLPQWRNLRALRRHLRAHRPGRRHPVQSQAQRRL